MARPMVSYPSSTSSICAFSTLRISSGRFHRTGFKDIHHPVVGDLHLRFEAMDLPADPGLPLVVYTAEAGSASEDGIHLLASWAATTEHPEQADTAHAKP
jgi:hypothetical protein